MSEIEKMKWYIEQTKMPDSPTDAYCLYLGELREIGEATKDDMFGTLCLLFEYGKAKGYRAAKAESRKRAAV